MKLFERVKSTQKTINKYLFQPFAWGACDCAILASDHLANFGIKTRLNEASNYKTELGAIRAMKRLGHDDLEGFADAHGFERIAPATAIVGDIVGLRGGTEEREWTALGVCVGNGRVIAFVDTGVGVSCNWGPTHLAKVAWRVA